ncbi:gamma-glutamyl phosphate reductase [Methylobacterium sp. Leaf469]|uniref:glutamate-5-semialdehyde dehydrogenase n=1 Tax=unclassified Methylobacterium TaxID=2615210 RepID=UPI0006F4A5A7|nr:MULTISPECIES: glutamate-5-semialdehyde dehydrogenase [unclassified Methylobacterium]KQO62089.1 gamma-glutamyl phosphate reductase [Methylobacterium sp. Leaf87]KQP34691.1 gamma-glutamyl phosphate reductase [Methylobacterium sp. Leaf102]KQP36942.1 gamma-glutamyl phosphate reductase [Methylobacterium sp. Leaf100]KQU05808.1 gamma-glutamyl phosphate reductase [Methylobacterium sp. Leaf469]
MPVLNLRTDFQAPDLTAEMHAIGQRARAAARGIALAPAQIKDIALRTIAERLRGAQSEILTENARDVEAARAAGQTQALIDRLTLDPTRLSAIADAVEKIGALPDPVGRQVAAFERPNGLLIERIAVPLGVIGVIFESRPNVTADAGALCLKAGNAAILRAGSDSHRTAMAIARAMRAGLEASGLPADAIQIVPTRDRAAVGAMLSGLDGCIDVIVPRGGRGLVERVHAEARVPVFAHLDGICHVYVAAGADLDMARTIALNSKMRRTGICGAAETLLVDRACASTHLAPLVTALIEAGCAVRGDTDVQAVDARVTPAAEADWRTEYLDAIIAVRVVDGLDAAITHIETYGSHHTDSIVTADRAEATRFLAEVDSAIVVHNASTQFADGGEFGFGAEIGIATGRMHARGPVGVEQLTTFKYRVHGSGQTRP